jgi:hypothetical protein
MTIPVKYGGLRWGESFWQAANVTWPFASWKLSSDSLEVTLGLGPFFVRRFSFARTEVKVLRPCHGIISSGVQIEHLKANYPPFIVFWSFTVDRLLADAESAGFPISNGSD